MAAGDLIIANMLFLEEHVRAILPDLQARRDSCDAIVGCMAASEVVTLTRLGGLDMAKPATGAMALIKRLRGARTPAAASGKSQMAMLRRLPRILRFLPGKAQDLRAWFLTMQYWLGGSDDNVEAMVRFLVSRYAGRSDWRGAAVAAPVEYPEVGLYHPRLAARIATRVADLPAPAEPKATVGLLDHARLRAVRRHRALRRGDRGARGARPAGHPGLRLRARLPPGDRGLFPRRAGRARSTPSSRSPASASSADPPTTTAAPPPTSWPRSTCPTSPRTRSSSRPSASGRRAPAASGRSRRRCWWRCPEIDGATNPTVFAGRHGADGCQGCAHRCTGSATSRAMAPCYERIEVLAARVARLAQLRRGRKAERRVGIVIFGFPPNAGAAGTAAYLGVFESLHNVLHALKADGYDTEPPESVEALRAAVLGGNAGQLGQPANVAAYVAADAIVRGEPHLREIEAQWGPAPGKHQSDGRGVFVLGRQFGNVFVGLQPAFGYEGDPMRLLFERGFAPTHAFNAFYRWLRTDFRADVLLHFGMHGALEFMPGKQSGMSGACWPDRLIGDVPNVYLYAANNPSEGTLAKRRSGATLVSHLTPPLAKAGLYKGLLELKDSLNRWRASPDDSPDRPDLAKLIRVQAEAVDIPGGTDPDGLWRTLLETENALIPEGLHVVGRPMTPEAIAEHHRGDGPRRRGARRGRGPARHRQRDCRRCCAPSTAASSGRCPAAT